MQKLTKFQIVNFLAERFGFRDYLELATPSTGNHYSKIDRNLFDHTTRMMYITPFTYEDGMEVDFRAPDEDLAGVLAEFRVSGRKVDICLVDGWHTYRTAHRDLVRMFGLLPDGGVLVVHDCLPPSRATATPSFRRGACCGVSYKAYLDFVLQTGSLDYCTVDCDFGCGIIVKNRSLDQMLAQDAPVLPSRPSVDMAAQWLETKTDFRKSYDVFEANRASLLRLISAQQFTGMFCAP